MVIQHKKSESGGKGIFFVGADGALLAELVYSMPTHDKMIIEHTEVDESLAGHGVGLKLVSTAVDFARQQQIKIIPLCPFAKSLFDKKPEWKDVHI